MKYAEARIGRTFIIRLEDGDRLPDAIEDFAMGKGVLRGMCILVGGVKGGGRIVVGPQDGESIPPVPMEFGLKGVHEIAAVGTLFPDEDGKPILHMHAALGREGDTRAGCIRPGIDVWMVGELMLLEIVDSSAHRAEDAATGFKLLEL